MTASRTLPAAPARLPDGFRVRIRPEVEWHGAGDLLLGGSPLRALRVAPTALSLLHGDLLEVRCPRSRALAERLLDANVADPDLRSVPVADPDTVTVVVPVRDRPEQLDRALDALHPLACLVVDDASHDPAAVAAVAARHGARVIRLPTNVGPAGARNAGSRQVETPYVAFVDSDVTVAADVLLRLARHFADQRVALVAPLVRSVARSPHPKWFERYDERSSSLELGYRGCEVRPGAHVAWLPSACLIARADALGDGFDEKMRVGEDVDLVWRLLAAEAIVRYDPSEVAYHDARDRVRDWLGRKFVYGTGGAPLAQRHGDRTAVAALSPSMAVAASALLLRRRWAAPLAAICLLHSRQALAAALPTDARPTLTTRLALRGLGWALRQEAALLLRHWAPPVLLGCVLSPQLRRAVVSALLVDTALALPTATRLPACEVSAHFISRRLDDLAYGAGLWAGLLHRDATPKSWRCVAIGTQRRSQSCRRPRGPMINLGSKPSAEPEARTKCR